MSSQIAENKNQHINSFAETMKRDWDQRAREDAKWYINTVRLGQSEEEFDATGLDEINSLILPELVLMTEGRDPKELKFLEIGCGIGRMTKHLAAIFGEVHSTDVSGEMVSRARQRLGHLPNVHLYETSGVDFDMLPDDYFDIAFSAYVFQHVPSKNVIEANIREAYRVIKPGGILRVHTNGVEAQSYAEAEKNTWAGATFTETEIRQLARDLGAQLVSVYGANTMFCWTMMRKPIRVGGPNQGRPRIEFHACAGNPSIKTIPTGGDDAWLALVISGLDRGWADAENLKVAFGGKLVTPRYVGRVRPHFEEALRKQLGQPPDELLYVEARVPSEAPSGRMIVSVSNSAGIGSHDYEVELVESRPPAPKIVTVRNGFDYQTEICASGPKSLLRLFVEGLNESANCDNVKVKVGETIIPPTFVGFVTDIASYQVDAQLPVGTKPGITPLELIFSGVASGTVAIEIKRGSVKP